MYITRVKLKDVRAFKELTLDIRIPPEDSNRVAPHTIIIGKNGTCKSSILRSIAVGLCNEWDANALVAEPIGRLVREGAKTGHIELQLRDVRGDGLDITTEFKNEGDTDEDFVNKQTRTKVPRNSSTPPMPLVCGYGPARAVGEGIDVVRTVRIPDSAYSLFDYHQTMTSAELILRRLKDTLRAKRYESTLASIKRIIGLSSEDTIEVEDSGGVFLAGPEIGARVALDGFADGHRAALRWILDMYGWAMRVQGALTDDGKIRGIVLIDEIEQHLHPKLRNQLLTELSDAMPELQIIATTHSPIVAMNAAKDELVVLHRQGRIVKRRDAGTTSGLSVEDVLVDQDLFDGPAYPEEIQRDLQTYHELSAKTTLTKRETTRLNSLGRKLAELAALTLAEDTDLENLRKRHGL